MNEAAPIEAIDPALLLTTIRRSDPRSAADLLAAQDDAVALQVLRNLSTAVAHDIIAELEPTRRDELSAAASPEEALQWSRNRSYAADTCAAPGTYKVAARRACSVAAGRLPASKARSLFCISAWPETMARTVRRARVSTPARTARVVVRSQFFIGNHAVER